MCIRDRINAIYEEYHEGLHGGVKGAAGWEAYYNEYMDKLEAAGLETAIEGYQEQVDEYLGK